jgi:hypothetical protein
MASGKGTAVGTAVRFGDGITNAFADADGDELIHPAKTSPKNKRPIIVLVKKNFI